MDGILSWISGELSTQGRVWSALAPAIVIACYFAVGLLIYTIRWAIKGSYRDAEIEKRGSSFLVAYPKNIPHFTSNTPSPRASHYADQSRCQSDSTVIWAQPRHAPRRRSRDPGGRHGVVD